MLNRKMFLANEEKHLSDQYRTNYQLMDSLLSNDFIEFSKSGKKLTKRDILTAMPLNVGDYKISDFQIVHKNNSYYQTCYKLQNSIGFHSIVYCTSSWKYEEGEWKLCFFQSTLSNQE